MKLIKASEYPITCIRWKPYFGLKAKNIISSVTADGKIQFWHSVSGKILYSIKEENPIMCLDFNNDGSLFAVAGNDMIVKLYDDNTKCQLAKLESKNYKNPGHSNRIFTVKFHKENDNILISGGWDNTLKIYDIREKEIVGSIYGPHIGGDSLDIKGNKILTGSWATENQIQIFDLRNHKPLIEYDISKLEYTKGSPSFLYCSKFAKCGNDKNKDLFGIAGSDENFFGAYEFFPENLDIRTGMISKNNQKSAYTIDFAYKEREFAVGSGDGNIHLISYKPK